jgi:hypothetical protein
MNKTQQFILMPIRGTTVASAPENERLMRFLTTLGMAKKTLSVQKSGEPAPPMRVLDSIRANGAKLVEIDPNDSASLRAAQPELRLVHIVHYRTALAPRMTASSRPAATGGAGSIMIATVVSR